MVYSVSDCTIEDLNKLLFFCFQAEDGIRDRDVTGVQTCALPISGRSGERSSSRGSSRAHWLFSSRPGRKGARARHELRSRSPRSLFSPASSATCSRATGWGRSGGAAAPLSSPGSSSRSPRQGAPWPRWEDASGFRQAEPPSNLSRVRRPQAPTLLGIFGAGVGIISIISALTPTLASRSDLVQGVLPPGVPSAARWVALAFGLALVWLAGSLARGKRRAWQLALVLVAGAALAHLAKGLDTEEAGASLLLLIALVRYRS